MDRITGQMTEEEILVLASQLAWSRPIETYPGWFFGKDWDVPNPAIQIRKVIWMHFRNQNRLVPFQMPWVNQLQFRMQLGNDVSQQMFVCGCLEPNELAFFDRFLEPGMTVIDIGANEGMFATLAASKVGKNGVLWAFEPSPRELDHLKQNIAINQLDWVKIFPVALGDQEGTGSLRIAEGAHAGLNTLGDFCYSVNTAYNVDVPIRRLDDLVQEHRLPKIDLLKIDVEGAETKVLKGAWGVLSSYRPVIMLEVLDEALKKQNSSAHELHQLFNQHRYHLYCFSRQTGRIVPCDATQSSENLIALPVERAVPRAF